MKIHIELEVEEHEIPMAAEMLAVLRNLTEHVSVLPSGPPLAPSPAGMVPIQPPMPAATSPPALAPLQLPQAVPLSPGGDLKTVFSTIIASSPYAEHPEQAAEQLESLAWAPSSTAPPAQRKRDPTFLLFTQAWEEVALNPALSAQGGSSAPYALLLSHLSPPFKDAVRDVVIPHILTHLTAKRPLDAPRTDFFIHAEAFAAMVSIGMMPMQGAITTLCGLIKDPSKRAAAVTVLGKMVELCGFMISDKVQPDTLQILQATLSAVTEEQFTYDVQYIRESMGWALPQQQVPDVAGSDAAFIEGAAYHSKQSVPWHLKPLTSLAAHGEHLFTMAMDPARRQLVTGGKDPFLQVWTEDGQPVQKLDLGGKYVASLDYHPRLNMLLAAGLEPPRDGAASPAPFMLAAFSAAEPNGFSLKGVISRDVQCACIKALPATTGFLTGESLNSVPVIHFWDTASSMAFQSLQPSQAFTGHEDVVLAIAVLPDPALFASCSKDGCVFLWDMRRGSQRVAACGETLAGGGAPRAAFAGNMITCLDCADHLLLTGSTDRTVKLWDLRMVGTMGAVASVDCSGQVVTKIAVLPGTRTAAVSAMPNLHELDFTNEATPVLTTVEPAWADGREVLAVLYHDIRWNSAGTALFAAGKSPKLDVYARV